MCIARAASVESFAGASCTGSWATRSSGRRLRAACSTRTCGGRAPSSWMPGCAGTTLTCESWTANVASCAGFCDALAEPAEPVVAAGPPTVSCVRPSAGSSTRRASFARDRQPAGLPELAAEPVQRARSGPGAPRLRARPRERAAAGSGTAARRPPSSGRARQAPSRSCARQRPGRGRVPAAPAERRSEGRGGRPRRSAGRGSRPWRSGRA